MSKGAKSKFERFFDEEDFTPSHDEMFSNLLENWTEYAKRLEYCEGTIGIDGSIEGEPVLEGYPPLYPDAIAIAYVNFDHRASIAITEPYSAYGDHEVICDICDTKAYFPSATKVSMIREKYICRPQHTILFEIKPKTESPARVLRQINVYKTREYKHKRLVGENTDTILITPDDKWDSLFHNQGVIPMRPIMPTMQINESKVVQP